MAGAGGGMAEAKPKGEGEASGRSASELQWSSTVEDLVDGGDIEGAISLLESLVSKLQTQESSNLRLASAISDLADLYSSRGFSLKADALREKAIITKLRSEGQQFCPPGNGPWVSNTVSETVGSNDVRESNHSAADPSHSSDKEDWEAFADDTSNELLFPQAQAGVPDLKEDTNIQAPKRRGRGSFLYEKNGLYSDLVADAAFEGNSWCECMSESSKESPGNRNSRYGTSHVLVLEDFPLSTRTTDLEKIFERFRDQEVAIRWVNDTTALAVFRNPSIAKEAWNSIHYPFVVRSLDENDVLLSSISSKDLEPPYPRPKTSVRTAQRLIAQGMGRKLTMGFDSGEFKKQEEARKSRIQARQIMKDEAWGPDGP